MKNKIYTDEKTFLKYYLTNDSQEKSELINAIKKTISRLFKDEKLLNRINDCKEMVIHLKEK